MIGRITFPGETPVVATLGPDEKFAVSGHLPEVNEAHRRMLEGEYADYPSGPAMGAPGVRFLEDKAREVGGRLELGPIRHMPKGTVH